MQQVIEITIVFFYFLIFLILLKRISFFKISFLPKNFLLYIFSLKVLFGIALAWIYTHHYTNRADADVFKYFDDSMYMYDALWTKPVDFFKMLIGYGNDTQYFTETYYGEMNNWFRQYESNIYNDSHTIIRFNAVLRIFSFGFFHVHTVFMCFISLIGLVAFYKSIVRFFKGKEYVLAIGIFLIPSVLFWTSGVLKEGLLIFGLGVFIYCIFSLQQNYKKWKLYPLLGICFFLLLYLKVYALLLLIPGLISFFINEKFSIKFPIIVYLCTFGLAGILALNFKHISANYDVLQSITIKQHDFISHAAHIHSGSRLEFEPLEPTVISFVKSIPQSFFITFFRPTFFESLSPLMMFSGLENLVFFLLIVFALFKQDKLNINQKNLFWMLLIYSFWMFVLVGLVTPVMGAIVRYKVPALPMLAAAFILLCDWNQMLNNHPKLKKRLKLS